MSQTKQDKLTQQITQKGISVNSVWYEWTFGVQPGGWFCNIDSKDEDDEPFSIEYFLGIKYKSAVENIENGTTEPPLPIQS